MILGFRQNDILRPMAQELRMKDPRMIKKLNDALHTIFVKHDIYQKVDYLNIRAIYPLPEHFEQ